MNYNLLEEDLINIITNICNSFIKEYDSKSLIEEANLILSEELNSLQRETDIFIRDINKYNTAIEELYLDKVNGKLPENIFRNLLDSYNDKLNNAIKLKSELDNKKILITSKLQILDYDSCAFVVKKFLAQKKHSKSMIAELIDRIEIDNDKKIYVFFKFQELASFVR